jgi:GNAT superfamily N-acetyltransferase
MTDAPSRPPAPVSTRPARAEDTDEVGRIQVRTWRAAYAALLPASTLDAMDPRIQGASWSRVTRPASVTRLLVAERGDRIVGFAAYGPHHEPDLDGRVGELYAIYVEPESWGTGAGHALMDAAVRGLLEAGWSGAILKVLEGNDRAREFYEREGWVFDRPTDPFDADGQPIPEVRYRRDL